MKGTGLRGLLVWASLAGTSILVGCHDRSANETAKSGKLTNDEISIGQRLGLLPAATTKYAAIEIIDDPAPPSNDPCTTGGAVNNDGVVVGWDCRTSQSFTIAPSPAPAFVSGRADAGLQSWSLNHASTTSLTLPSGVTSVFPAAINASGDIAGTGYSASTGKWAPPTLWMHAGNRCGGNAPNNLPTGPITLPLLGDTSIGGMTNDVCPVIAGATVVSGSPAYHWFFYDPTPTNTVIATALLPDGYVTSQADAINSSKEMSGMIWTSDNKWWAAAATYAYPPADTWTWVYLTDGMEAGNGFQRLEEGRAINDSHQIVGSGIATTNCSGNCRHAFVADLTTFESGANPAQTGKVVDLGTISGYENAGDYIAQGINSHGQIVGAIFAGGTADRPGSYPIRAFVWTREWGMRDLSSLLDPALGLVLNNAIGISDTDEIVGWFKRPGEGYQLYRMRIDLGPTFIEPTGGQTSTVAKGINNAGVVIGWSDNRQADFPSATQAYPFFADGTGPHPLTNPVPGATAFVWGINNDGTIGGGVIQPSNGHASPALVYGPASLTPDTMSFEPPFAGDTGVTAVNNESPPKLAGGAVNNDPSPSEQWFWAQSDGTKYNVHFLPHPTGVSVGDAFAINDAGDMAGFYIRTSGQWVAAAYSHGGTAPEDLNATAMVQNLGTWLLSIAFGINGSKQVVGVGKPAGTGTDHGFLVDLDAKTVADLWPLPGHTEWATTARAINSKGYVVGTAGNAADAHGYRFFGQRAFVYTTDSGMTDLNNLVSMPPGWTLKDAAAINDNNEVAGYAEDADGNRRAYRVRIPSIPSKATFSSLVPITYTLDRDSRVSINIYSADYDGDGTGRIIRELLHGAERTAGANTEYWDGCSDMPARVGWGATASVDPDSASLTVDNDPQTFWSASTQTTGTTFQINMQSELSFSEIALDAGTHIDDFPRKFEASVSTDGMTFGNPIATGQGTEALVKVRFPTQNARSIRIRITDDAPHAWTIHEFKVTCPRVSGQVKWKMLATPGFNVEYVTSPGMSFPMNDSARVWETLGGHSGPLGIAMNPAEPSEVYIIERTEGGSILAKYQVDETQTPPRATPRWFAAQPPIWTVPISIGTTASHVWVYAEHRYEPPGAINHVQTRVMKLYRYEPSGSPASRSLGVVPSPDATNYDGPGLQCDLTGAHASDMAILDGSPPLVAFAFPTEGQVRFFQLVENPMTHVLTCPAGPRASIDLAGVKSVDLDSSGVAYMLAGDRLYKSAPNEPASEVMTDLPLVSPLRAAVRPNSSPTELYVLERGNKVDEYDLRDHNQIQHLRVSDGHVCHTYGATRQNGIYDPRTFFGSNDILVGASGDFWVSEGEAAPMRLAHFNPAPGASCNPSNADGGTDGGANGDQSSLIAEWYGGQNWSPSVTVEPDDPHYVWMSTGFTGERGSCSTPEECAQLHYDLMRMHVDYDNKSWSMDSIFGVDGYVIGNGLSGGYGGTPWRARIQNGEMYLLTDGGVTAFKFDRSARTLTPVTIVTPHKISPGLPDVATADVSWLCSNPNMQSMRWTDLGPPFNGKPDCTCPGGTPTGPECTYASSAIPFDSGGVAPRIISTTSSADPSHGFDYLSFKRVDDQNLQIGRLTASSSGSTFPFYGSFPGEMVVATAAFPDWMLTNRSDDRTPLTTDSAGRIWGTFNNRNIGDRFIARFSTNGSVAWRVGQPGYGPGNLTQIHRVYGPVENLIGGVPNKNVVTGGIDILWNTLGVMPIYVFNEDGLYAGQVFGRPVDPSVPPWRYFNALDGSGTIQQDAYGNVYLYTEWINEARVFKIGGWTDWQKDAGVVDAPSAESAARIAEAIGPLGNGRGLLGTYFANTTWTEPPAFAPRIDPILNTDILNPNGGWNFPDSTMNSPVKDFKDYSVRWTGTLTPRRTGWHMFTGKTRQYASGNTKNSYYVNGTSVGDANTRDRAIWLEAGKRYPVIINLTTDVGAADPGWNTTAHGDFNDGAGGNNRLEWQWSEPETNGYFTDVPTSQLDPP